MTPRKILAIIPARSGSKRIPHKNTKYFLGKPLIAYTIAQALNCFFVDRVIVDTDSQSTANIAKKYGIQFLWLRPKRLARDTANVVDSIIYSLEKLKKTQGYEPTHVMILQVTSPLREIGDIQVCWRIMQQGGATTVLTVCPTHPKLYYLDKRNFLRLVNGSEKTTNNMQAWPPGFIPNGFVYIVETKALLKERSIITKKTKAVICPKWRSIDLDTHEDWALGECLYRHKTALDRRIKQLYGKK